MRDYIYSVWWNLLVITAGAFVYVYGVKAVAVPHGFITGGVFGTGLLVYYATDWLSPGWWNLILNLPLFAVAWLGVSRRFFLYSLYCMVLTSLLYEVLPFNAHVHNELYAAVAAGVITGAGAGMVLRTLGSGGGLDVVAVWLFRKYNIGVGRFYFVYNGCLFAITLAKLEADLVIASMILVFISSVTVEYVLAMFSQRKVCLIISERSKEIAHEVMHTMRLGATWLKGWGAYSGRDADILMTVTNNIQLKRLEELVFTIDPQALFIVENTFSVLGSTFSKRKLY